MTPEQRKRLLDSLASHEPARPERLDQLKFALHQAQQKYDSARCRELARLIDAEIAAINAQRD